jgi:hypothetical protein
MNSFDSLTPVKHPVMPDDHSNVVPLLPIPNRTVKRVSANDSADSRVKVGHRQASIRTPCSVSEGFIFEKVDTSLNSVS